MIKSSCPPGGTVLDPFAGSGTTVEACIKNNRHYVAFEINEKYYATIQKRIEKALLKDQAALKRPAVPCSGRSSTACVSAQAKLFE